MVIMKLQWPSLTTSLNGEGRQKFTCWIRTTVRVVLLPAVILDCWQSNMQIKLVSATTSIIIYSYLCCYYEGNWNTSCQMAVGCNHLCSSCVYNKAKIKHAKYTTFENAHTTCIPPWKTCAQIQALLDDGWCSVCHVLNVNHKCQAIPYGKESPEHTFIYSRFVHVHIYVSQVH